MARAASDERRTKRKAFFLFSLSLSSSTPKSCNSRGSFRVLQASMSKGGPLQEPFGSAFLPLRLLLRCRPLITIVTVSHTQCHCATPLLPLLLLHHPPPYYDSGFHYSYHLQVLLTTPYALNTCCFGVRTCYLLFHLLRLLAT